LSSCANGERFLGEALASVFLSETRPIEILVIDGGSTDRTAEIARGFPLTRVVAQEGTGIARAYNQGITEANGRTDSDAPRCSVPAGALP
jgi:glycosyltransferase involved in cell wall biosynthesis